jgi:uncharacterized LabA/DUF88 family protein
MERIAIFIDGANFSYGIISINKRYSDFRFDFEKYFKFLTKGGTFAGFWYYTCPLKGSQTLNTDQQIMMSRLEKITGSHCRMCKIQKNLQESYQHVQPSPTIMSTPASNTTRTTYSNKMDDVWMAVDMVNEAWKNTFDTAIMISGDGDLLPAVNFVIKEKNKKVHLVGFPGRTSYSLVESCSSYQPVSKRIAKKHFYSREREIHDRGKVKL